MPGWALSRPVGASHRWLTGSEARVILDTSNARGVLGSNPQCPAFLLRSDETPEMHDPTCDDHATFRRICPILLTQLGKQLASDRSVLLFISRFNAAAR